MFNCSLGRLGRKVLLGCITAGMNLEFATHLDGSNFAMSDIDQRHMGIEVAMQVPIVGGLSFNGALSLGSYVYTSNPNVTQTVDNSAEKVLENVKVYWKGMYVESTPQTAANLGLSYRSSNNWFARCSA